MRFFKKGKPALTLPKDPSLLYRMAQKEEDAKRKHDLLLQAEKLSPDDLKIQRALLMLGNLYRRDEKKMNLRLIKFYLFHAFEHPEAHSRQEQEEMAREFFDDPLLQKCLSLSPDPAVFMREYLREMAASYIDVFIQGDNTHSPSLLGVPLTGHPEKYFARPAAAIIRNIFLCPLLKDEEKNLLAGIFYQAFYQFVNGKTEALDEELGKDICGLLT